MKMRAIDRAIYESGHLDKEARAEYLRNHSKIDAADARYLAEELERKRERR